jgi:adsorption protein B
VFDRALQRSAMVQLPVVPIVGASDSLVSGHYLDEFASAHARDMMVRTLLGAPVPSAGVGTAIDRDAVALLEGADRAPFNATSLTEDYELGYRIHRLRLSGAMVRHRIGGRLVAVRSYFPDSLPAAVRQKSRWLLGIALTGWDRLGWKGGFAARWMLLRDRKTVATSVLALATYAVLALVLVSRGLAELAGIPAGGGGPGLDLGGTGPKGPAFRWLMAALALALVWRLLLRAFFTWRVAGPVQAMLAIPRAPVGNLVNALSALRAMNSYRAELLSGRRRSWDKTEHRFPASVGGANG